MRAQSILKQYFSPELAVRFRLEYLLIDDRDVPLGEILRSHCQLSRREQPALPFLWRGTQRAERVTEVTGRVTHGKLFLIGVGHALHLERHKYLLAQKL